MDNKFVLPSPNFAKNSKDAGNSTKLHYLTPCGMTLLPRSKQPPPMYGARGATVPAKFLQSTSTKSEAQQVVEQKPPQPTYELTSVMAPEQHFCDVCEMELQSSRDLQRHIQQHESCPIANCGYVGHPSVMDKHVGSLHVTGLYSEVKKMSTPEEIAAWRAERCKRYPTAANVEQCRLAKEQRKRRGERLDAANNRFGNVEDRKRVRQHRNGSDKRKKEGEQRKSNGNKPKRENQKEQVGQHKPAAPHIDKIEKKVYKEIEDEPSVGLPMFRGTSLMSDYKHFSTKNVKPKNALAGLMAMYGSGDDETDEEEDQQVDNIIVNKKLVIENTNSASVVENVAEHAPSIEPTQFEKASEEDNNNCLEENVQDDSSDDAPEELPIVRKVEPQIEVETVAKKDTDQSTKPVCKDSNLKRKSAVQLKKIKSGLDYRKSRLRKQNTLLEKLLESDIRHERNVLLQCVRFVCENKFFGIGQDNNTKNT